MTTQIFCASTLHGAATVAAAMDAGCFRPARRRILLVSNNAAVPEVSPSLDELPGFDALRDRFDEVLSWNAAIAPFHPSGWSPRSGDAPMWERHLRRLWELGDDDVELTVESVESVEGGASGPAVAVTGIFLGTPVHVYEDGLAGYGPTGSKLDPLLGTRVRRLLHLGLVPGVKPLLLMEFGVEAEVIPADAFRTVLRKAAAAAPAPEVPYGAPALLIGECLSGLPGLGPEEEEELHLRMLRGAVERGHRNLVLVPHPTAPAHAYGPLESEAERLGVELTVLEAALLEPSALEPSALEPSLLAETLFEQIRPALVVGCFSPALFTARQLYGLDVASTGTREVLERLTPFEHSDRVPVVLAHTLLPELEKRPGTGPEAGLETGLTRTPGNPGRLVTALGFVMQPRIHAGLRPAATAYLAGGITPAEQELFPRRRLTVLGLPGGLPGRLAALTRNPALRRAAGRARRLGRTVLR
ncbi:polysialyltransferase family glycosyltransferase [Streptomyces sp. NPDC057136]|uniref:polysialyltransferase family glycosyltransferase n=1 Tax=Streptomyces sp. NPDC057136 TaxID=3346029 RepID=UPI00362BBE07